MRIAMFGFQTWGQRTLQALLDSGHEVVLAVTHPASDDAYKGIWADSVEDLARANGIPVHVTVRADAGTIALVASAAPDVIVVNSWYTKFPRELYELPPHGTLNLHDSLLPEFTGFSPVLWALISGADRTGLTVHRMNDELDGGDILIQRSVAIGPDDTGPSLVRAGMDLIPDVLRDALAALEAGTATWVPQDPARRSYFHKRSERDSRIDWNWPAVDLERFVRALAAPYPSAYTYYRGERLRVLRAEVAPARYGGTPGRALIIEGVGVVVVCGPDAHRGGNPGLVLRQVALGDGIACEPAEVIGGGYLTDHPVRGPRTT